MILALLSHVARFVPSSCRIFKNIYFAATLGWEREEVGEGGGGGKEEEEEAEEEELEAERSRRRKTFACSKDYKRIPTR